MFGSKKKFITIFNKFYKIVILLQRESVRSVEPSIHNGENIKHQAYNILKNLQRKKVTKPHMLKTMKVDEDNKGTNQMSVSKKSK